jgi:hypothetical protein
VLHAPDVTTDGDGRHRADEFAMRHRTVLPSHASVLGVLTLWLYHQQRPVGSSTA